MAANLAPIYLNNDRVTLQGDPRPDVAKIVTSFGKRPDAVRVVRLQTATDSDGQPIAMSEVIDRSSDATTPVYLRCFEGETTSGSQWRKGSSPKGTSPGSTPAAPSPPTDTSHVSS